MNEYNDPNQRPHDTDFKIQTRETLRRESTKAPGNGQDPPGQTEAPPIGTDSNAVPGDSQPKPTPLKFLGADPIPQPPRKPDGRINWAELTREQLAALAESYPVTQVAQAWGVSPSTVFKVTRKFGIRIGGGKWTTAAAQQRREWQALHAPPPRPVIKKPVPWSNPAKFLHQLWEIGAPKIARMYDCDHTILYDHAKALDLPHPGHGYWQRKNREIPAEVVARMAKLDAEAADAPRATAAENASSTSPPESPSQTFRPASPPPAEYDSGPERASSPASGTIEDGPWLKSESEVLGEKLDAGDSLTPEAKPGTAQGNPSISPPIQL